MFFENQTFDEPLFVEKLNELKADQLNIVKIIASTIDKPIEAVQNLIHNTRATLTPEQAKEEGLVTAIKSDLIPLNTNLISIYD